MTYTNVPAISVCDEAYGVNFWIIKKLYPMYKMKILMDETALMHLFSKW